MCGLYVHNVSKRVNFNLVLHFMYKKYQAPKYGWCICMCTCVCAQVSMYVCMYIYADLCICVYVHVCIYALPRHTVIYWHYCLMHNAKEVYIIISPDRSFVFYQQAWLFAVLICCCNVHIFLWWENKVSFLLFIQLKLDLSFHRLVTYFKTVAAFMRLN